MHPDARRSRHLPAALLGAAAILALLALTGPIVRSAAGVEDPPQPAPPAASAPAAPEAEPPPRIIRTVCTDHICGHCDGKCHKESGHVAVDKKGHCACTPTEGGALDRATRDAYEKNQPK